MNNAGFRKNMESFRKHKDIKFEKKNNKKRRNYLVSQPNYDTIKLFADTLLGIKMKNYQILINKSVYLGLSILELND